jgi:hypothetical protein
MQTSSLLRAALAASLVVACGGSSATIGETSASPDGAPAPAPSAPSSIDPANVADSGADAGNDFIYGSCSPTTTKPLTAGSHADGKAGYTVSWPSPWTGASDSSIFAISKPYSYLPTGATTTREAKAVVFLHAPEQRTSAADATKRLADIKLEYADAVTRDLTIDGHAAFIRWVQQPPPQPGCQGCAGDPGPDMVTITLAIAAGDLVIRFDGSARVNAPSDVFCEIQAIELSATFK